MFFIISDHLIIFIYYVFLFNVNHFKSSYTLNRSRLESNFTNLFFFNLLILSYLKYFILHYEWVSSNYSLLINLSNLYLVFIIEVYYKQDNSFFWINIKLIFSLLKHYLIKLLISNHLTYYFINHLLTLIILNFSFQFVNYLILLLYH